MQWFVKHQSKKIPTPHPQTREKASTWAKRQRANFPAAGQYFHSNVLAFPCLRVKVIFISI